ncbi:MAG TPA: hypothetical protein PLK06_02695, partial [bacterium]|nr:hypothetical protein [bacterium]
EAGERRHMEALVISLRLALRMLARDWRAGELNVFLTAKVTERFLGEARHPDNYSVRKVANNLLNAVSTSER